MSIIVINAINIICNLYFVPLLLQRFVPVLANVRGIIIQLVREIIIPYFKLCHTVFFFFFLRPLPPRQSRVPSPMAA